MILPILILISIVFFVLAFCYDRTADAHEDLFGFSWVASIVIVFVVIFFSVVGIIGDKTLKTTVQRHEVVAIQDNIGQGGTSDGSIFYFSGSTSTGLYYSWYEKRSDGSYFSRTINIDTDNRIKVYELSDNQKPYVRETTYKGSCVTDKSILFFDICPDWNVRTDETGITYWEVYVPKGTIKRDFTLDAKS